MTWLVESIKMAAKVIMQCLGRGETDGSLWLIQILDVSPGIDEMETMCHYIIRT